MLTKLKQKVQQTLIAEAKAAHKMGLTPNLVSIMGFALALLSAIAYARTTEAQPIMLLLAVALLMASGFCDALDGILARTYQQGTKFGGFFDSLLDRYSDAAAYAGIIVSGLCDPTVGLIALIGSFMVSYSRARAEVIGIKMETIGLAERPERIIVLAIFSIVAIFWLPALTIGIAVLAAVSNLTALQRALHVYKSLKTDEKQRN